MDRRITADQLLEAIRAGDVQRALAVAASMPPARDQHHPVALGIEEAVSTGRRQVADALVSAAPQAAAWLAGKAISAAVRSGDLEYAIEVCSKRIAPTLPLATLLVRSAQAGRWDLIERMGTLFPDELLGLALAPAATAAIERRDPKTLGALVRINGPIYAFDNARELLPLAGAQTSMLAELFKHEDAAGSLLRILLRDAPVDFLSNTALMQSVLSVWPGSPTVLEHLVSSARIGLPLGGAAKEVIENHLATTTAFEGLGNTEGQFDLP